mgnify:CR=1 FL=1
MLNAKNIAEILMIVIIHNIVRSLKKRFQLPKEKLLIQSNPLIIIPENIVAKDQVEALRDSASVLFLDVVFRMINGNEQSASAKTSGAVDATFNAILSLVDIDPKLQLYSVTNVTQGTDSLGEVNVRLEYEGKIVNGQGVDTDIITSSAKAYVNALNKVMTNVERAHPQI